MYRLFWLDEYRPASDPFFLGLIVNKVSRMTKSFFHEKTGNSVLSAPEVSASVSDVSIDANMSDNVDATRDANVLNPDVLSAEFPYGKDLTKLRIIAEGTVSQKGILLSLYQTLRNCQNSHPQVRARAGQLLGQLGDPRVALIQIENMEFCHISSGAFLMGNHAADKDSKQNSKPLHEVEINYDYWIARYPITCAHFVHFVKAGGYQNPIYWTEADVGGFWKNGEVLGCTQVWNKEELEWEFPYISLSSPYDRGKPWTLPNHPQADISWYEAIAFCRWLTDHLHNEDLLSSDYIISLPSEAEWEKAARGGFQLPCQRAICSLNQLYSSPPISIKNPYPDRIYPWGYELNFNWLNYDKTGLNITTALGCFPDGISPYGVEEMSGNVCEWTRSLWGATIWEPDFSYPYFSNDGREELIVNKRMGRVVRGGSWGADHHWVRLTSRSGLLPASRLNNVGFRCTIVPKRL